MVLLYLNLLMLIQLCYFPKILKQSEKMKQDEGYLQLAMNWLDGLMKARIGYQMEITSVEDIVMVEAKQGLIRCNLTVSDKVSGVDGNWHVGAIASLIDVIGATAIYSVVGHVKASVDFNISYYSTAKIQEEVEIMAKVIALHDRLASVVVEIRKKDNGEMIALGKQWMTEAKLAIITTSTSHVSSSSKL